MPLCLHLRLLHAWRYVPHDGEERPDGVAFLKSLQEQATSFQFYL